MKIKLFLAGLTALSITAGVASAQQLPQLNMADKLPLDPEVRIGRLDNGMAYYLRPNGNPAGMADFYIVHHVGAVQEEDSQNGLAHFLEHMAFNGTKNFPGNSMIKWLESIGLQFGTNINAATGMEMTYYQLTQVPLRRPGITDSALLVLHDWSHFLTLDDAGIDKERGVIVEELRQRNNAQYRIGRKAAQYVYGDTRHATRDMLGTEEFLRTFDGQELRDYYRRWYRPDLQAVVIVGDFDAEDIERRLRAVMADIPAPEGTGAKEVIIIPDNAEPVVAVVTDPELRATTANLYIKRMAPPKVYNDQVGISYMNTMIGVVAAMTNVRLSELAQQEGCPFASARLGNSSLTEYTDALELQVTARGNAIAEAFTSAYGELERIRRYGFTQDELDLVRMNILRGGKHAFDTEDERQSASYVWELINHYVKNAPVMSAQHKWAVMQVMLMQMTTQDVNGLAAQLITPTNNVLVISAPESAKPYLPAAEELAPFFSWIRTAEIDNYVAETVDEPLISQNPTPGKVVKSGPGKYGSTVWTLGNGIQVVVLPTMFSRNQIQMTAVAGGGLSAVTDADYYTASMLVPVVGRSGVGDFTAAQLRKVVGSRSASAMPTLARFTSGINGGSAKADVETMLQLTWLYFTSPRLERPEFDRIMEGNRMSMQSVQGSADFALSQHTNSAMHGDNPRTQPPTEETLATIDFDRMDDLYRMFFTDAAGNYTFYFLGDIDMNTLRPLVEKYLGSLPAGSQKPAWKDDGVKVRPGAITDRFTAPMETPAARVNYTYTGPVEYTQQNTMIVGMLAACLRTRYLQTIREERGAAYTVNVNGQLARQPEPSYSLSVSFQTDPALVDGMTAIVERELQQIADEGPDPEDIAKNLEYWRKSYPEGLNNNNAWLSLLQNYDMWGEQWSTDYDALLDGITPEAVQTFARRIIGDGNLVKVIMEPEK